MLPTCATLTVSIATIGIREMTTIPFSLVSNALKQLAPKAITITGGGEPNVYSSEGNKFPALVAEIRKALPKAGLGLINNNSHIPSGEWTAEFEWQRTSIDAATAETFFAIKGRPLFETVIENVKTASQRYEHSPCRDWFFV